MSKQTRSELKGVFQTGAIPTAADFADLIDSSLSLTDDGVSLGGANQVTIGGGPAGARLTVHGHYDVPMQGTLDVPATTAPAQNVIVTGTGTRFASALQVQHRFRIANEFFTVVSVASDVQMTVTRDLAGAALSAAQALRAGSTFAVVDAAGAVQFLINAEGLVGIGEKPSAAAQLNVRGAVHAGSFAGDGPAITNLNAANIASGVIDASHLPAAVVTGPIDASRIPNLDAGKITTGTIDSARLPNDVVSGQIAASRIPGIDASKISGVIDASHLPAAVVTGPIDASRIPNLDAGKITAGTIDSARLPNDVVSGQIAASRIPGIDASKISGVIDASHLPAAVVTGPIDASRIPNLDAGKITTGTIDSARLPNVVATGPIDASRITGTIDVQRLPAAIQTIATMSFLSLNGLQIAGQPAATPNPPSPTPVWKIGVAALNQIPALLFESSPAHITWLDNAGKLTVQAVDVTGDLNVTHGVLRGDGSGLSNVSMANLGGSVPLAKGGTGLTTAGSAGNLLRSNGTSWESTRLRVEDLPDQSAVFIQNATSQQAAANFNIAGNGKAAVFDAAHGYSIGGLTVLSKPNDSSLFAGDSAGSLNTSGTENCFFGNKAGAGNTTGKKNCCFGYQSGVLNTVLAGNSYFGAQSGMNATGAFNSFFGNGTGLDNTGSANSFFGMFAGNNSKSEQYSAFFGYNSGRSNQDGEFNSVFGALADADVKLKNATAIGAKAKVTQSNSLVLGSIAGINNSNDSVKVGIGVTAPSSLLTLKPASKSDAAIEITQGAIKITGAGYKTQTSVFIHEANATNIDTTHPSSTSLDHPFTNNDSSSILIVTPLKFLGQQAAPHAVYVEFDTVSQRWRITHVDGSNMSAGETFNVLIFRP